MFELSGERGRNRTYNLLIKSQLLCQLSYAPFWVTVARGMCASPAGGEVRADDAATTLQIPAMQESVLSLAVREGVTNVVRHANAHNCRLRIEQQNGSCRLEIADDGQGFISMEGNGLRGMRERVEMLGGTLDRRNKSGTTLTITLPLKEVAVKDDTHNEIISREEKTHELESPR